MSHATDYLCGKIIECVKDNDKNYQDIKNIIFVMDIVNKLPEIIEIENMETIINVIYTIAPNDMTECDNMIIDIIQAQRKIKQIDLSAMVEEIENQPIEQ